MKLSRFLVLFVSLILILCNGSLLSEELSILNNGMANPLVKVGFGVDDAHQNRNWLAQTVNGLALNYPGNMPWGAVFLTSGGAPIPFPRDAVSYNLSKFDTLAIEMRGEKGDECVMIGMKDYDDPDNGTEPKVDVSLSSEWQTYKFSISDKFGKRPPNLSKLDKSKTYIFCEFVFPCKTNNPQTIYVKNIKFIQ